MNCLIVNDEVIYRSTLKEMISMDPSLNLVAECGDTTEAYKIIMNNQIDLVFLEVNLRDNTGLDLAKTLKGKTPSVILMSSESEYAVEAYHLNVSDYLVKPVHLSRFHESIERVKRRINRSEPIGTTKEDNFIFIRDSYVIRKIYVNDILYIEAKDNYAMIHFADRFYTIHSSIKFIEQKLPPSSFFRVHRSYLVNLSKVDSIEGKTIVINKSLVPVSDTYRADLNRRVQIL